jgi:predicted HTH domain antitoxin
MSRTISTRLPEEAVDELERIAEEEHLDRSALVRKLLLDDLEADRLERALEGYRRGEMGVEEAAERAGVSIWRFVDETIRENVQPPPETTEQLEAELEEMRETLADA